MGKVNIIESGTQATMTLDGNTGDISTGGEGQNGTIIVKNHLGKDIVRLGYFIEILPGPPGGVNFPLPVIKFELNDEAGQARIRLNASNGDVVIGGNGADGDLFVRNKEGKDTIHLNGDGGDIWAGGKGHSGDLVLFPTSASQMHDLAQATIHLNGQTSTIALKNNGQEQLSLDGKNGQIFLNRHGVPVIILDPIYGNVRIGGGGVGGDMALYPVGADGAGLGNDLQNYNRASIQLNGNNGRIVLRKHKEGGLFWEPEDSIILDPELGNFRIGGPAGAAGNIAIYPANASATDLQDFNNANIHLNGQSGDIFLKNADCAEEFDISGSGVIEPGTVMVLNQEGKLQQSSEAYDMKVAGVISGAGDYKPGIVLDKQHTQAKRLPVALMGKVSCKVDATYAPIGVGDLLTTSSTPGHAMKASDHLRAFGAVIGKALRPLSAGQGLIPILIALQ